MFESDLVGWLCERIGLPVLREDAAGKLRANAAAEEAVGADPSSGLVATLARLTAHQPDEAQLARAIEAARDGSPQQLEGHNGQQVLVLADARGTLTAVVVPGEFRQQALLERRAASADITAGVSHELANALGAIAGWARLAKEGHRVNEALDLIEKSANNAWSAARRVLTDVSHGPSEAEGPVELSELVDEAARLLAPKAAAKGVQIDTRITPNLRVIADRAAAWSIVWNLAVNAVEALSRGGHLELRLARDAGGDVALLVSDDGPGMTEEQASRAFEPYFTTKRTGTGLGLAKVKEAVDGVGGAIELRSARGTGTRFSVRLPAAPTDSRRPNGKRSSGVFYAEPVDRRVLVVDDDAGLREMIATALSMRGAEVVCVPDAASALAQAGPFALAIVDLLLPGMRGDELLSKLKRAGVVSKGMIASGTELPDKLAEGGAPDGVLRKPFALEDLFERLSELLESDDDRASAAG